MLSFKSLPLALVFSVIPLAVAAQQPTSLDDVVDKIVAQEQAEMQSLRKYSPLVETYIQYLRPDPELGAVPDGDKYFLGRAKLAKGVVLELMKRDVGMKQKLRETWREFYSMEFVPAGFLQMIYVDRNGFDLQHYKIEYLRREFLGDIRCLVFAVNPLPKAGKRRFVGRIWVEDGDYHIVRFNGAYGETSETSYYFNFDSWRTNVGTNLWLPAFVYVEEGNVEDAKALSLGFKPFRAQTRLWGYHLGYAQSEQELSKILVESARPVTDQTANANDYSPVQAERLWEQTAEDNVAEYLQRKGLMAPPGDVDKVLETVVNNLATTNSLDIEPEVHCRVLMTSTLESFTMGHTIVLSRGLIDVLPDEASLAAILAHELGHIVLGHHMDTQFGFYNRLQFDEKETFDRFDFSRSAADEQSAKEKGLELLRNSPYREQSASAQAFLQALRNCSKEIPNLISPGLGDRVPTDWSLTATVTDSAHAREQKSGSVVAGLPLGGRIKINPWNDQLQMLKPKPAGVVAEGERRPFQLTPLAFYLTYEEKSPPKATTGGVAAKLDADGRP